MSRLLGQTGLSDGNLFFFFFLFFSIAPVSLIESISVLLHQWRPGSKSGIHFLPFIARKSNLRWHLNAKFRGGHSIAPKP